MRQGYIVKSVSNTTIHLLYLAMIARDKCVFFVV